MTLMEMLNRTVGLFRERKISDARLNAELLLCDVLKFDRVKLYLNFDKPVSEAEKAIYREHIRRRLKGEPVQYILGKTCFFGIEFMVDKNVLIPRPETEILVEKILDDIRKSSDGKISIFEIGAGSGCISIALGKELEKLNIEYEINSIDSSAEALSIAQKNLKTIMPGSTKISFFQKNVFDIEKLNKKFDYIISNPPYISKEEYQNLEIEVKNFEPRHALTDSGDGLKFYERIFKIALSDDFKPKVFCEIGFGQRQMIETLLKQFGFELYMFYKDYSGIDRILEVRK